MLIILSPFFIYILFTNNPTSNGVDSIFNRAGDIIQSWLKNLRDGNTKM